MDSISLEDEVQELLANICQQPVVPGFTVMFQDAFIRVYLCNFKTDCEDKSKVH